MVKNLIFDTKQHFPHTEFISWVKEFGKNTKTNQDLPISFRIFVKQMKRTTRNIIQLKKSENKFGSINFISYICITNGQRPS